MVSSLTNIENAFIDENMDDVSQEKHRYLLQTITSKTKRKIQPTIRNEPSLQVSEFHLSSGKQTTNVNDLTNALKNKALHKNQKFQLTKSNKQPLKKPLDKVYAEKIKRAVAYDNFKKHVSRWSTVIESNKSADQLTFPLSSNDEVQVFDNQMVGFTKNISQPTDLQKQINNILQSSKYVQQKQKYLKISWMEKEKNKYPLTLKELLEKRKTMAKFRAQESYRHVKAHRQNKIKSKKYHKLLKKEKVKEQIEEFEKLQNVDPVAALEKLNVIEKTRAIERASLRHKSTGQWAQNHIVRAKYDKNSRIALAEQLRKGKELTQKVGQPLIEETDSNTSDDEQGITEQTIDPDNPWLTERKDYKDFMTGYRNFVQNSCNIVNENDKKEEKKLNNEESGNTEFDSQSNDQVVKLKKKKKKSIKNKIKNITMEELAILDNVDSDVEILKIVDSQKKKINFSNDSVKPESKINNINVNFTAANNKKDTEIIRTAAAGTWLVSSDNINTKKIKIHKDIQDAFKTVETELKNKITEKLKIINKVEVKNPKKDAKYKVKKVKDNSLKLNYQYTKTKFNEPLCEYNKTLDKINSNNIEKGELNTNIKKKTIKPTQNIDPSQFLQVSQTNLETEEMNQVEDHLDDKEKNEQEMLIAEAFADDDIINEFKEEKKKLEEQSKPKIETALPGWGSWAGPNIRKRTFRKTSNMRGMFRTPAKPPRKDFNREKVIIHENADDAIKSHLVSELPYPFNDVDKYEETIKIPVGQTWVPETVFHKLTAPPVVTQMGQIIEPINENSIVKQLKLNN